jgi:hypothetical protein
MVAGSGKVLDLDARVRERFADPAFSPPPQLNWAAICASTSRGQRRRLQEAYEFGNCQVIEDNPQI